MVMREYPWDILDAFGEGIIEAAWFLLCLFTYSLSVFFTLLNLSLAIVVVSYPIKGSPRRGKIIAWINDGEESTSRIWRETRKRARFARGVPPESFVLSAGGSFSEIGLLGSTSFLLQLGNGNGHVPQMPAPPIEATSRTLRRCCPGRKISRWRLIRRRSSRCPRADPDRTPPMWKPSGAASAAGRCWSAMATSMA